MDDGEGDDLRYSNSMKLKPSVKQQNDEIKTFEMNNSNNDFDFSQRKQNLNSNRQRLRAKFAYSFDNDRVLPMIQTTVIKTEPCFKVIKLEDKNTKDFYQNKFQMNSNQPIKERIPSEVDSLEDEYLYKSIKEKESIRPEISDRISSSSPIKSILKKPQKKEEENSISKSDRSTISRSRSPSPSFKKKQISSSTIDSNEVQYLAEMTAKQNPAPSSIHSRSLFAQTMSIFDPNYSSQIIQDKNRSSKLQYYIKPYRGEANIPTNLNKHRSRSLSQNRLLQQYEKKSFSNNQFNNRQSNRKQHVSWSPVRQYIHQGKVYTITTPTNKKEISFDRTSSSLLSTKMNPSLSSSNPCLRNVSPMVAASNRYRCPSSSTESYNTPSSSIDYSLRSDISSRKEENKNLLEMKSSSSNKEHDETIERYDRLLEKMRTTDEELQSLSRTWSNNSQQRRIPVEMDRESSLSFKKITNENHFISPIILQMCLIILVIFNLLVVYFFNEINIWWSEYIAPVIDLQQQNQDTFDF